MQKPFLFLLGLWIAGAASADDWKLTWSDEFDHDGPPDRLEMDL